MVADTLIKSAGCCAGISGKSVVSAGVLLAGMVN
jgi:hypothetical protein